MAWHALVRWYGGLDGLRVLCGPPGDARYVAERTGWQGADALQLDDDGDPAVHVGGDSRRQCVALVWSTPQDASQRLPRLCRGGCRDDRHSAGERESPHGGYESVRRQHGDVRQ